MSFDQYRCCTLCTFIVFILYTVTFVFVKDEHRGIVHESHIFEFMPLKTMSYNHVFELNGETEWSQYLFWLKKKDHSSTNTNFTHWTSILVPKHAYSDFTNQLNVQRQKFTVHHQVNNTSFINIQIDSTQREGGANFRIEVLGKTYIQICSYKDLFNGKYVAICDVDINTIEGDYSINIFLQFINFHAFDVVRSENRLIWKKKMKSENKIYKKYEPCTDFRNKDLSNGYWIFDNECYHSTNSVFDFVNKSSVYKTMNKSVDSCPPFYIQPHSQVDSLSSFKYVLANKKCYVPNIPSTFIRSCLNNKYSSYFTVIGDSHMRYIFGYLQIILNRQNPLYEKSKKYVATPSEQFYWVTTCQSRIEALQDYEKYLETSHKSKHLLLMDGGAWDLAKEGHTVSI